MTNQTTFDPTKAILEDEPIEPIQVCLHCTRPPITQKKPGHELMTLTHECHVVKYSRTGFVDRPNMMYNQWNRLWDQVRETVEKQKGKRIL